MAYPAVTGTSLDGVISLARARKNSGLARPLDSRLSASGLARVQQLGPRGMADGVLVGEDADELGALVVA